MKIINLILLLDASSSIRGTKPGILSDATNNLIQMFQTLTCAYPGLEANIGALRFGDRVISTPLCSANSFVLEDMEYTGTTQMGAMFNVLSNELSSNPLFSSQNNTRTIIALLSDGVATDVLSDGFKVLLSNPIFIASRRIAVAIGECVYLPLLSSFCTLSSDVYTAISIEEVGIIIRQTISSLLGPKPSLKYERKTKTLSEWD